LQERYHNYIGRRYREMAKWKEGEDIPLRKNEECKAPLWCPCPTCRSKETKEG